ncbi:hypothetical protein TCON_1102 [Astathelohania contejeani]|uniref:Uncharacterized protein n=1 Tax=Astathelohania contejeani TaxID=164912 RepID=A0ABQ7HZS2_9MICR|nr:hypothetical protein TCON_1102 [Thelohania contejeani]
MPVQKINNIVKIQDKLSNGIKDINKKLTVLVNSHLYSNLHQISDDELNFIYNSINCDNNILSISVSQLHYMFSKTAVDNLLVFSEISNTLWVSYLNSIRMYLIDDLSLFSQGFILLNAGNQESINNFFEALKDGLGDPQNGIFYGYTLGEIVEVLKTNDRKRALFLKHYNTIFKELQIYFELKLTLKNKFKVI